MTLNGIEVDETREDESADLIVEAGRIARGEDGYKPDRHVQALVDELGGALRSLVDEFTAAGTVSQLHGAVSEEAIHHAMHLLARLEP